VIAPETADALGDTITIIRAPARRLSKLVSATGAVESCDAARTFDMAEVPVANLPSLERSLMAPTLPLRLRHCPGRDRRLESEASGPTMHREVAWRGAAHAPVHGSGGTLVLQGDDARRLIADREMIKRT
jgi:hypothetical protein